MSTKAAHMLGAYTAAVATGAARPTTMTEIASGDIAKETTLFKVSHSRGELCHALV